eukprot:1319312-Amorphochlora_amoeboformis.AAC.1
MDAVVVKTGANTFFGRAAGMISEVSPHQPPYRGLGLGLGLSRVGVRVRVRVRVRVKVSFEKVRSESRLELGLPASGRGKRNRLEKAWKGTRGRESEWGKRASGGRGARGGKRARGVREREGFESERGSRARQCCDMAIRVHMCMQMHTHMRMIRLGSREGSR